MKMTERNSSGTTTMDMDAMLDEVLDELDDDDDDDNDDITDSDNGIQAHSCFGQSELDNTKKEQHVDDRTTPLHEGLSSSTKTTTTTTQHDVLIDDSTTTATTTGLASINDEGSVGACTTPVTSSPSKTEELLTTDNSLAGINATTKKSNVKPETPKARKKNTKTNTGTKDGHKGDGDKLNDTMAAILQEMAKAGIQDPQQNHHHHYQPQSSSQSSSAPEMENMIQQLLQSLQNDVGSLPDMSPEDFTNGDNDFNPDTLMEGMMEQLLSKELMYEPMKQVKDKFPAWLDANKETLSVEEFTQRTQQYECFCKLVEVYESPSASSDGGGGGKNMDRLMELMQQIQEFGQPPAEIVNEIAPGLELDKDGIPKMDGLPLFGGGGGEDGECIVM
jgi:hypothetical protein